MTSEELLATTRLWVPRLELQHWLVRHDMSEPCDPRYNATSYFSEDYEVLTVNFNEHYPTWEYEFGEHVVVHELLHARTHRFWVAAVEGMHGFSLEAGKLYERRIKHELESLVDSLTRNFLRAYRKENYALQVEEISDKTPSEELQSADHGTQPGN